MIMNHLRPVLTPEVTKYAVGSRPNLAGFVVTASKRNNEVTKHSSLSKSSKEKYDSSLETKSDNEEQLAHY